MSFEYLIDPEQGPRWTGLLPGTPAALRPAPRRGRARRALQRPVHRAAVRRRDARGSSGSSPAESPAGDIIPTHSHNEHPRDVLRARGQGAALLPGRRGRQDVPAARTPATSASCRPASRTPTRSRRRRGCSGVVTGGFERFFQHMGTPTDHADAGPAAVHPRLPPDAGRRPAARHAVPAAASTGRTPDAVIAGAAARPRRRRCPPPSAPRPGGDPACCSACRTPLLPGARPLELDLVPPARRCRTGARRGLPARRRLAARAAGTRPGPRTPAPTRRRSSGWRRRVSPSRASTTGCPARRPGPPSCTTPRRRSAGCGPAPDELGIDPDADRRLGRVGRRPPRRAARPHRRPTRLSRARSASPGRRAAVAAVVAWYAPSDVAAVATDTGADPADPTTREALLLGAAPGRRPGAGRAGQPGHHVAGRRAAVPAAARRRRPARPAPCRASGCTTRAGRGRRRRRAARLRRAPTTCGCGVAGGGRRPSHHDAHHRRPAAGDARPSEQEDDDEDRRHPPRHGGDVQVASLSQDGGAVTVLAGLEEFWADAAGHLAAAAGRAAVPRRRRRVRAAGAARRPGDLHRAELPQARRRGLASRDEELPEHPTLFARWTQSLTVDGAEVPVPVGRGRAGLGGRGRGLRRRARWSTPTPDEALAAVVGYSTFNDLTVPAGPEAHLASGSSARTATAPARSGPIVPGRRGRRPARRPAGAAPGSTARPCRTAAPTRWSTPSATPSR